MNKIFNILSITCFLTIALSSCEDRPEVYQFPVDEYFYDIPEVPVTEDYVIGVSYDLRTRDANRQMWWDNDKKAHLLYTGHPALGEYDIKTDEEVLQKHLEWGKEAGIDFFIINWSGHGYADTLLRRYEALWETDRHYPRVVIRFDPNYLSNRPGWREAVDTLQSVVTGKDSVVYIVHTDTLMRNAQRMDTLRADVDSLYLNVMMHDYAYKNKDKSMMILCEYVNKSSKITHLKEFVDFFKKENIFTGQPNKLWIAGELPSNWSSPENWGYRDETTHGVVKGDTVGALDAMFITNLEHTNYDRYIGQYSFLDYNYRYWQEKMLPLGKEYIPMIFPAYDNRIRESTSQNYLIPRWKEGNPEGEQAYVVSSIQAEGTSVEYNFSSLKKNPYQEFANVAKRNVGPSRIIIIRNWNGYGDGNTLEPTVEYGSDYLKYTRQFFKK